MWLFIRLVFGEFPLLSTLYVAISWYMCCHEEGVCETNTTLQVYLLKLASINMNWKKAYILYVFIFRVHLSQPLRFVFVGVCTAHTLVLKTFPPGTGLSLWMLQLQRFNTFLSWKVTSFLQAFFFFLKPLLHSESCLPRQYACQQAGGANGPEWWLIRLILNYNHRIVKAAQQ